MKKARGQKNKMKFTKNLSSKVDEVSIDMLGGKGYNLVKLANNGFQVPNAFIICTESFKECKAMWFDKYKDLKISEISDELIEQIQKEFDNQEMKKDVMDEIQNEVRLLVENSPIPSPLLAVRSSGIAEDLDNASFAGMNDTILNVPSDLQSICKAVKQCWKSLYSRRSIEYRIQHHFPALDTAIAVVVEIMIPSEKAGVAFTADTQTGSRSHVCIDGVQGMGEALVSGLVNTDHWVLRKASLKHSWYIEEEFIGKQEFKLVSNYPKEGTTQVTLSEEEAKTPAFSKAQLEEILHMSMNIEQVYKKPMDIEFAFYHDTLYILQARPITHLLAIPDCIISVNPLLHPEEKEWGCFINIGYFQMLTDPFTPMGYSTVLHMAGVSSKYLLYVNGFLYMDLSGFIESRLFRWFTITKFRSMADEELAQILTEIYKKESGYYSHQQAKIAKKGINDNFFKPMLKLFMKLSRQKLDPDSLERSILDVYNEELAVADKILQIAEKHSPTFIQDVLAVPFDAIDAMCRMKGYVQFAMKKYEKIIALVKKYGLEEKDAERLWQAPEENIANQYNQEIIQIGKYLVQAGFEEKVRSLREKESKEAVEEWFEELKNQPEHSQFYNKWQAFMSKFGCRCHSEIDVGAPRYSDVPYKVLEMALNVANSDLISEEEMVTKREQALLELQSKVPARVFKKITHLLPTASLLMKYREHQKYAFIRILHAYHKAILTMGELLFKQGLLEEAYDVFYLQLDDLIQFEKGENDGQQFKHIVEEAKKVMESATTFSTPRMLCKPEGLMITLSQRTRRKLAELNENQLRGVPTSAGIVEGRAIVATDPHSTVLQKGDILVTKATDPSWTPLFSSAAAIVIEIGGPLTHGSVVAKELGIPCIVGVPGLTEKIHTGMTIRMDGSTGVIEIV